MDGADGYTVCWWAYTENGNHKSVTMRSTDVDGTRYFNAHAPWTDDIIYDNPDPESDDSPTNRTWQRITYANNSAQWVNQWSHWAFVYTPGTQQIYLNGEVVAEGTGELFDNAILVGATQFSFGAEADGSNPFQGIMDDVRLYNTALELEEIQTVMAGAATASDPDPEDGEDVLAAQTTTLSWTNADGTDACDVYFSAYDDALDENGDPNRNRMEHLFFDPEVTSVAIDDFASYSTPLDEGTYVWIVDCNVPNRNPAPDNFWTFNIVGNVAPVVDAGNSIVTWLAAAQAGIALDGTVTDENGPDDIESIKWTVIDPAYPGMDPWDIIFDDDTDPDTTVTISEAEPREYVLVLTAIDKADPPHEVSDTILITVYADACEAAMNNPVEDYTPLEFDFDGNCQEDVYDLAVLVGRWLESNTTARLRYFRGS